MAYYSWSGFQQYNVSAGGQANPNAGAVMEIRAGPTDYPCILEIGISITGVNTNATPILLGRASAGINPFVPYAFVPDDGTTALSGVQVGVAWLTNPTALSTIRRANTTSSNNMQVPFRFGFPRGLKLIPNTSLFVRYTGANFEWGVLWLEIDG